jgi:hypothetical protein
LKSGLPEYFSQFILIAIADLSTNIHQLINHQQQQTNLTYHVSYGHLHIDNDNQYYNIAIVLYIWFVDI